MLDIKSIKYGDDLWQLVIDYAPNCSWGAGAFLAKQMKESGFTDWERRANIQHLYMTGQSKVLKKIIALTLKM